MQVVEGLRWRLWSHGHWRMISTLQHPSASSRSQWCSLKSEHPIAWGQPPSLRLRDRPQLFALPFQNRLGSSFRTKLQGIMVGPGSRMPATQKNDSHDVQEYIHEIVRRRRAKRFLKSLLWFAVGGRRYCHCGPDGSHTTSSLGKFPRPARDRNCVLRQRR